MTSGADLSGLSFAWPRFWLPRTADVTLDGGAFLWDPDGPFSRGINPGARSLTGIDDRLVVLLGEPGSGKTRSVTDYAAVASQVTHISLPDEVSHEGIRAAVDAALTTRPEIVEIVFDGLDEAMVRARQSDKWLPAALRNRSAEDLERLRVRVTCRPAVWPESLATQLAALWPDVSATVMTLGPLRRVDVLSAATQIGVDGEAFLAGLAAHDVLPFAARPVTVVSLLLDFAEGKLPTSKTDVYLSMCKRLSRELNQGHREARLSAPPAGPDALVVAGRLASLSTFTGRPVLWRDDGTREPQAQELSADDATGSGGIDAAALHRALDTGLFGTAGSDRFHFAHRTYGEFLAAHHASDVGVSDDDLLALVLDPDGRVQPQLGEVAAWLAALRPAIFERLVSTDPEVLLDSDVATRSDADRERLAVALLAGQENPPSPRLHPGSLRRLGCARLAGRLTEVLTAPGHSDRARSAALEIAVAVEPMRGTIIDIVCDPGADADLRSAAGRRLPEVLSPDAVTRLSQLVATPNLDEELRGVLLRRLWPDTLTLDEVLAAAGHLPAVTAGRRLHTSYSHFLTRTLPDNVAVADLPRALEWARAHVDDSTAHGDAADGLAMRALATLDATTADAVATIYLARHRVHGPGRQGLHTAVAAAVRDQDRRRLLLSAAVANSVGSTPHRVAIRWLGNADDFAWALDHVCDTAKGTEERARWLDAATRWFVPGHDHLQVVWDRRDDPGVRNAFSFLLDGIRTDSEEAKVAQGVLRDERERTAQEQRRVEVERADAAAAAAALASDDTDAWMTLMAALDPDLHDGMEPRVDHLAGWARLTPAEQESATVLARRWLLARKPPSPSTSGWWPAEVAHALRALWLYADDAALLDELTAEQWASWARVLLGAVIVGDDSDERVRRDALLARAYRRAPDAVHQALRSELDLEVERAQTQLAATPTEPGRVPDPLRQVNPFSAHIAAESIWDDQLSEVLLTWQRSREDDLGLADTVPFLVGHGCTEALGLAVEVLGDAGIDNIAARRRVAAAVALLASPEPAEHWPAIWARWNTDPDFGTAVLAHVSHAAGWDLPPAFDALEPDTLAELYLWLHPRRSPTKSGRVDPATDVAEAILSHLEAAGTAEATAALQRLRDALPCEPELPYRLAVATRNLRANSWQPPAPADVRALLDDPRRRLVTSDRGLAKVVLASLQRAQQRLSGKTPAVADLWDHPQNPALREPKTEPFLSDWLARHLRDDLGSVLVNREVEITPGFAGVRKMRETDLLVGTLTSSGDSAASQALEVIIENKGCWNPKLDTDITDQLADTYLAQTGGGAGIYVVFAFDCHASKSKRACASCRRRTADELRVELMQRADALSIPARTIQVFVLDAQLAPP